MPSPGGQFLSDEFGDIEDYFVTDYWLIDQYIGDQLWVMGQNNQGQLGTNDTTPDRGTPVTTFAGGTNWKSITTGGYNTGAIKTDGSLWVWSNNGNAKLGDNTTTTRSIPVTTFAGGNNWKSVSPAKSSYMAAIKTDGSLWVWGRNNNGQLGIFNTDQKNTPVTTFAGGTNWKSVATGGYHTAAIKTDGSLWVWGFNTSGQLGINNNDLKNTPVTTFAGGNDWKQVSSGSSHTAAIKTDGSLWVWGLNDYAQLGINIGAGTRNTPVTTFAGGNNWKQVSSGNSHISAIKTDGSLWGWGYNDYGLIGNNTITTRSTPVTTFAGGTNWKQVSSGSAQTMAIKTDGTLWGWGFTGGRLGNGETGFGIRSIPVTTFAGGNNWKSVSTGQNHTAAIKSGLNVDLS